MRLNSKNIIGCLRHPLQLSLRGVQLLARLLHLGGLLPPGGVLPELIFSKYYCVFLLFLYFNVLFFCIFVFLLRCPSGTA